MWKSTVNSALQRFTGHQLRKVGDTPAQSTSDSGSSGAGPEEVRKLRRKVRALTADLERANGRASNVQDRTAPVRKPRAVPRHYDAAAAGILRRVRPRTMTGFEKLYGLVQATRYVVQHDIAGDVVECGVWRGGSMQAVALALIQQGVTDRHLHLFDTFEGMPPPTEKDVRHDGQSAESLLATSDRRQPVWAVAGVEDVQEAIREVEYPMAYVHFHQGLVEDTIPQQAPDRISILRLDTDWYESTRHELEHLYDRLSPGGVLIIDDYGHWEGSRLATEEFLQKTREPLLLLPLGTGRITVKPAR